MKKTNAMRILDRHKVDYETFQYPHEGKALEGGQVAALMGQDPRHVFKTLVTVGAGGGIYVFVIPVCKELDLKKAAAAVKEKSVSMLQTAKLLETVGYMRGACTPIGMKKSFTTLFDASAEECGYIFISGGCLGSQIKAKPGDIMACCGAGTAEITAEP